MHLYVNVFRFCWWLLFVSQKNTHESVRKGEEKMRVRKKTNRNQQKNRRACLIIYKGRFIIETPRIAKHRIIFTYKWKQRLFFTFWVPVKCVSFFVIRDDFSFGFVFCSSSSLTPQHLTKTRHDFFPVYCSHLDIYIKTLSSYLDEGFTIHMRLPNKRLRAHTPKKNAFWNQTREERIK